ncbi:MAG: serine hydrolase domain-containing protein, partial [Bacteroidota bacterium]
GDETPALAVGIVQNGEITYEEYVGYANLEHKVKADKNTRFNIASNCKQYTALSILLLAEEGKLKLDDDFRTYLPEILPNISDKITIRDLIAHTSGIREIHSLYALQGYDWYELFIDNGDAIDLLKRQKGLNFKPGTAFTYSNSNYILLAEIVTKVSGQSFAKYSKKMFERLGMPDTDYLTNHMSVIPHRSRPYANWGSWREYPAVTELHGDGNLFTTLRDQLRFEQVVQRNDGSVLSKALLTQSQQEIAFDYSYGLEVKDLNGLPYTYHDGSFGAYKSTFLRFPTKDLSIVVTGNNSGVPSNYLAWQIATDMLDLKAAPRASYPAQPEKIGSLKNIQQVLGLYQGTGDDATVIRITEREGNLYREIYQRDPDRLIPQQGALFAYENIKGLNIHFTNIGQPDQQFTLYMATQAPTTYRKISDEDYDGFDKTELNGTFYNDETDTEIILEFREDDTYALTKNGRTREAKLILKDYIRMLSAYQIYAVRDQAGKVIGLNVNNDRMKQVEFKKR